MVKAIEKRLGVADSKIAIFSAVQVEQELGGEKIIPVLSMSESQANTNPLEQALDTIYQQQHQLQNQLNSLQDQLQTAEAKSQSQQPAAVSGYQLKLRKGKK
jgi:hypothetical protein